MSDDAIRNFGSHEPCDPRRIEPFGYDARQIHHEFKIKIPSPLVVAIMETLPQGATIHDTILALLHEAINVRVRAANLDHAR